MRTFVIAGAIALGLASLPLTAADAGSTWIVTAKASTDTVVAGKKVVLTGHVRPGTAAAGSTVTLQEKFKPGVPWKKSDQATVSSDGTYKLVTKPTHAYTHAYRVVVPATKHHAKGISPTLKVKVFAWTNLISHTSVNGNDMTFGTVNLDGTAYPDSMTPYSWAGDGSSIEFNVDHLCVKLRSTFGLSDDSTTGGQGEVSVQSDGSPLYSSTFEVGQHETRTLRLAPAPLKLRVEAHSTSTTAGVVGLGAFGTPQVLCSN
jgi:hypothetical protein